MIIQLKQDIDLDQAEALGRSLKAIVLQGPQGHLLVTSSKVQALPAAAKAVAAEHWVFPNDLQLGSREFMSETRSVQIGEAIVGGGNERTVMMTGPCSIESEAWPRNSWYVSDACR